MADTDATERSVQDRAESEGGPALLTSLAVDDLFGRYSYELVVPDTAMVQRLVLFYGDNGTGKTTVLRLIWHLLSPAGNRGHRTALRNIPFRSLKARLSNNAEITLTKDHGLVGPFSIQIITPTGDSIISEWGADQEHNVFSDWDIDQLRNGLPDLPEELQRHANAAISRLSYIEFLESLEVRPYFLADDRNIYSDALDDEPRRRAEPWRSEPWRTPPRPNTPDSFQGIIAQELEDSIRRASSMLQQLALGGTTSGSAGANSVYLDVLQRIGHSGATDAQSSDELSDRLVNRLETIGQRSLDFEALGLVPALPTADFVETLRALPSSRVAIADEVITPYLSSLEARLNALQAAQELIQTFLDQANGFLSDKVLTFSPRRGLRIQLRESEYLNPLQLSSGERQLILLLCNALLSRNGTRLFLIDEPELSLNAKWQRMIVPALIACTTGTAVQFLIATHSIELLSAYRDNVIRLETTSRAG